MEDALQHYWREFLRQHARQSNAGAIRTGKGVEAAWVHSALIVNNGTYLTNPVTTEAELRACCQEAAADAAPHGLPWLFFVYEPMVDAALLPSLDALFEAEGYHRAAGLQEMTADASALAAPVRPMPNLRMERVSDEATVRAALDLNCMAYGMPLEITDSVVPTGAYFADPAREYGYVAYSGNVPVSTASVELLDDVLYVMCVATHPEHRQKGYAEAVMRHALADSARLTGLRKTALDASAMGHALYLQMGYSDGPVWRYYIKM